MKFWLDPQYKLSFEYAKLLTKEYAKSFYFASNLLPEESRWATYALYGFCRYADNLIDNPRDRTTGELIMEVDAFGDELEKAYNTGESEHPVLKAFIVVAERYKIPLKYPLDLLRGVKMDVQRSRYANFDELYIFAYRVAGVVGLMMTHVLGYSDKSAFQYAERLCIAMQLTNILRDIQEDMQMNRMYMPHNELSDYGLSEKDISEEHMSENFREFMKFQVARADQYYDEANKGISLLNRRSRFSIYAASKIYRGILRKIEKRNYNPFLGRVHVSKGRKIAILISEFIRTRLSLSEYRKLDFDEENDTNFINKKIA